MIWFFVIAMIFAVLFTIGLSSYRSAKRTFTVVALGLLILFLIGAIFGASLREHLNWGNYKSIWFNAEDITKFYTHLFKMAPNWFHISVYLSPFIFYVGRITGWYRTHQKTLSRVSMFELISFFKLKFLNPNRYNCKELIITQSKKFSLPSFENVTKVICRLIIGLPVLYWLYE